MLDNDEYYDIKIEVGNDPNIKHSRSYCYLNFLFPYIRRMLLTNKKKMLHGIAIVQYFHFFVKLIATFKMISVLFVCQFWFDGITWYV